VVLGPPVVVRRPEREGGVGGGAPLPDPGFPPGGPPGVPPGAGRPAPFRGEEGGEVGVGGGVVATGERRGGEGLVGPVWDILVLICLSERDLPNCLETPSVSFFSEGSPFIDADRGEVGPF